ncbi:MAG: vWA domain-containing protein [Anaeromyxobacteraceae bacterium]
MLTTAQLTYEKLRFDEAKDLHLVVTLTAPRTAWQAKRPRICVIPVIDVSGSMQGAKLHYAKQSVLKLVDHLAPGDLCGVVTFTDEVRTIAPPAELTQARKDALKAAVGELATQGSTNFAGGLLAGLECAARVQVPPGTVKRVIMFTDGHANVGVATKGPELLRLLDAHLGDASVSAFGYGDDADQELLRDLATRGKGNYAFVQNPEDAITAFARELGGLLSTYARDVDVAVRPAPGARLLGVVSDVDATPDGGGVHLRIADLLSEEVRHLVLGVALPAAAAPGRAPVALVEVRYKVVDPDSARSREERFEVAVEVERVPAGEEQRAPTPAVDEVVALAELVRAQIEAEEQARRGAFATARDVMHTLHVALHARGRGAAADACARVLATFADRAAYEDSGSFRTSMKSGVTRGSRGMKHRDAEVLLRKSGVALSTAAQDVMAERFREDDPKPPAPPAPPAPKTPRAPGTLARKRSKRW